eukprot:366971-Amphidinium_carterae.1
MLSLCLGTLAELLGAWSSLAVLSLGRNRLVGSIPEVALHYISSKLHALASCLASHMLGDWATDFVGAAGFAGKSVPCLVGILTLSRIPTVIDYFANSNHEEVKRKGCAT